MILGQPTRVSWATGGSGSSNFMFFFESILSGFRLERRERGLASDFPPSNIEHRAFKGRPKQSLHLGWCRRQEDGVEAGVGT